MTTPRTPVEVGLSVRCILEYAMGKTIGGDSKRSDDAAQSVSLELDEFGKLHAYRIGKEAHKPGIGTRVYETGQPRVCSTDDFR